MTSCAVGIALLRVTYSTLDLGNVDLHVHPAAVRVIEMSGDENTLYGQVNVALGIGDLMLIQGSHNRANVSFHGSPRLRGVIVDGVNNTLTGTLDLTLLTLLNSTTAETALLIFGKNHVVNMALNVSASSTYSGVEVWGSGHHLRLQGAIKGFASGVYVEGSHISVEAHETGCIFNSVRWGVSFNNASYGSLSGTFITDTINQGIDQTYNHASI
jgi:hypothetical protein